MKFLEDYQFVKESVIFDENKPNQTSFQIEIINPDSEFFGWVFQVNSIKLEENEKEDEARLSIDYDLVKPDTISEEMYPGGTSNDKIIKVLGDSVIDLLMMAVENKSLKVGDEEILKNDNTPESNSE